MTSNCFWITGLSASGKTTISHKLQKLLIENNQKVILLDGDVLRRIFKHDKYDVNSRLTYGYIYADLCKFLISQNLNVIISVGGLFHELHEWNRKNISGYIEIFLDVPFNELEKRDPKGLYKNYKIGSVKNLNGVDIKPQLPINPNIHLKWQNGENENKTFSKLIYNLKENYTDLEYLL